MQLTKQNIQIVEKTITNENGVFLARFAVAYIGGEFKAKLVSMVPIDTPESISNTILLLESPKVEQVIGYSEPLSDLIPSPYSELSFFISQPTRAPNFA